MVVMHWNIRFLGVRNVLLRLKVGEVRIFFTRAVFFPFCTLFLAERALDTAPVFSLETSFFATVFLGAAAFLAGAAAFLAGAFLAAATFFPPLFSAGAAASVHTCIQHTFDRGKKRRKRRFENDDERAKRKERKRRKDARDTYPLSLPT